MTTIGLIGTGMLGAAMAQGWRDSGIAADRLILCNRSGICDALPDLEVLTDPQALVARCDVLVVCVPPATLPALRIAAADRLVLSVVAGATLAQLSERTGASRVVRAMSSPAAARRMAYSPRIGSTAVTAEDDALVAELLQRIGQTDLLTDEDHINLFTALTGPVPGFVAACAAAMAQHTEAQGIAPEVADRAVRQLFAASGQMLLEDPQSPAAQVQEMIDYAGTTAAGLTVLRDGPFAQSLSDALAAATQKARDIAR